METAVSYLRVSGKGQITGQGFERQEATIKDFSENSGFRIIKVYQESISGTDIDRPVFLGMLQDLLSNGCRIIVVESLDRLARDLTVQMQLIALLINKGICLYSATTGQNVTDAMSSDPMHKALIQIQGTFAELDKSLLVRKLQKARESTRRAKGRCEGRKPFGTLPGEPEALERIKQLYRKPRNGERLGFYRIAKILNDEGFKTRMGKPWGGQQVGQILKRINLSKSS